MRGRTARTGRPGLFFPASRTIRVSRVGRTAAVLGALLLAVGTGCSSAPVAEVHTSVQAKAHPEALPVVDLAALPEATTFTTLPGAPLDTEPGRETNGVVLRVEDDLAVYDRPHGAAFARLPATQLNNPTWVPVIAQRGAWARILLPSRPNGATGWVHTGEHVDWARSPYLVDVDIDARRLVVRESGREIGAWTVGVGAVDTPTPRGRTFILASIQETVTRFSPITLPLGTHSEALTTYGGGPGTVALHGWPSPAVFGRAMSDGCVRVPDDALRLLTTLPLGTVVLLR